jgi:integrase
VLVNGKIQIAPPKSRNGLRTLPLDATVASALHALKVVQATEKLAAGGGANTDSGYVVADELGEPVHPEWYSDEFGRLAKRAGVKKIVLHEGRHTTLSLMEKAGVPISIVSKWAGHYDTAFIYSTYVHATEDDLTVGTDALGGSTRCHSSTSVRVKMGDDTTSDTSQGPVSKPRTRP